MTIIDHPSPNYNARPAGMTPSVVVLHGTAGASAEADVRWLCDEARDEHGQTYDTSLSYHYVVGRERTIYHLVDEGDRAWHAGKSEWDGRADVNDFSIGVGLSNKGPVGGDARNPPYEPYPTDQILAAAELVVDICARHDIPWRLVLTHAQVSPGRKHDPWLHFPLGEMAGAMLSYQRILTDHGDNRIPPLTENNPDRLVD